MTYYDMATITSAQASIIESEGSAIGLIPLGSLEQHGPHLPLATDSLVADHLARLVAESLTNPVVVAPTFRGGISTFHLAFSGTVDVPAESLGRVIDVYVDGLTRLGIKQIAVFSGHGGNCAYIGKYASERLFAPDQADPQVIAFADLDRYLETMHEGARTAGLDPSETDIHAGAVETSQALVAFPELVGPFGDIHGYTDPEPGWHKKVMTEGLQTVTANGVLGDASLASKEVGFAVFEALRVRARYLDL